MKSKFVLVGCEESGRVTEALRKRGVNAFSCDVLPTSGNLPQYHFQGDLFDPTGRNRGFSGSFRDPTLRSKTFQGIADAMAEQWESYFSDRGA